MVVVSSTKIAPPVSRAMLRRKVDEFTERVS